MAIFILRIHTKPNLVNGIIPSTSVNHFNQTLKDKIRRISFLFSNLRKTWRNIQCVTWEIFQFNFVTDRGSDLILYNLFNRGLIKLPSSVSYCKTAVLMTAYWEKNSNIASVPLTLSPHLGQSADTPRTRSNPFTFRKGSI